MLRGEQLVPVDARIKAAYRKIASTPAAAIECSLAEVRPNPARNPRGIWDPEVLGIFKKMVLNEVRYHQSSSFEFRFVSCNLKSSIRSTFSHLVVD